VEDTHDDASTDDDDDDDDASGAACADVSSVVRTRRDFCAR